MATNIVMPQMGYDMREGTVVRWHKQEGDTIARGEVLADIETDKATVEFEAYTGGVLGKIVADAGVVIPVGELIAVITAPGEILPPDLADTAPPEPVQGSAPAREEAAVAPPPVAVVSVPSGPAGEDDRLRASPIARRLARERGISLADVTGTGPGGRIVEKDVLEYTPAPSAPAPPELSPPEPAEDGRLRASPIARRLARERGINLADVTGTGPGGRIVEKDVLEYTLPMSEPEPEPESAPEASEVPTQPQVQQVELSRMRQAIARVTSDSKRDAPHFYVTAAIDMTRAMTLRQEINGAAPEGVRVTVNDLAVKAAALALGKHPKFNASFQGDSLRFSSAVNIGIAIALEAGLMVPGISDCQDKTLLQIAAASKDLIERANAGRLRNDEYGGTTFSISNLGMFDVESFAAIIYPPHAAVLAVGAVQEQPVARDGQLAVAQMMKATLSTDHRVADGAEAARFLVEVKGILENPITLLL